METLALKDFAAPHIKPMKMCCIVLSSAAATLCVVVVVVVSVLLIARVHFISFEFHYIWW